MHRRDFLKLTAALGAATSLAFMEPSGIGRRFFPVTHSPSAPTGCQR